VSFVRKGHAEGDDVVVLLNMTPVPRLDWKVKVRGRTRWKELFNSDHPSYGGSGDVYNPDIPVEVLDKGEGLCELTLHLPPLGAVVLG
jgi:1,4-alpha-glucan branching enzyme